MALAEGISIRQYIDGWLMTTIQDSNARDTPTGGASCREPGLDHKFLKSVLFPTTLIKVMVIIQPRGRSSLPNSKESIVFLERQLPC